MRIALVTGFVLLGPLASALAADTPYRVVEAKSSVRVHVGKAGMLSFAGHLHEVEAPVSGTVTADPASLAGSSVDLTFTAARTRVLAEGEPKGDAPKVEEVMHGPTVLDALRFPEVRFHSKTVTGKAVTPMNYEVEVTGDLSLHGVTREITVPLRVTLEGSTLVATGRATLIHDQFAMKPVTAGGGTVKVANEIRIEFRIVAER
jgi:polyisoprenoid-binding protein YceI